MTDDEKTLEHLKLIQAVIARMAQNSFQLKSLAAALTAGVLALIGATSSPNWIVPAASIFPLVLFWILDAKYLTLEQKYRELYEDVRNGKHPSNYGLNYQAATFSFLRTDWKNFNSWSVRWFYLPIILLMVAILILISI